MEERRLVGRLFSYPGNDDISGAFEQGQLMTKAILR